jgi:hypothetical protein
MLMIATRSQCWKGKVYMDSQEMREELESFVNKGIEEGWSGWPLKNWSTDGDALRLTCRMAVSTFGFLSRFGEGMFPLDGRLSRYYDPQYGDDGLLS